MKSNITYEEGTIFGTTHFWALLIVLCLKEQLDDGQITQTEWFLI
jgi:hypothetical protein